MQLSSKLVGPSSRKKKIHSQKSFLYFGKWNFLALILRKRKPWIKYLVFQETFYISANNFSSSKNIHLKKILYILGNGNSKKTSYIFSKKLFFFFRKWRSQVNSLYFRKQKFLVFHEVTFRARKVSYISENETF